jgi:hypothetical protein
MNINPTTYKTKKNGSRALKLADLIDSTENRFAKVIENAKQELSVNLGKLVSETRYR